jgi:SAM-dependent methyltransferase
MDLTIAFPGSPGAGAIEERYGAWHSRLLAGAGAAGARSLAFSQEESAGQIARRCETEWLLVITDPLIVTPPNVAERLRDALQGSGGFAAVPATNESDHPAQRRAPAAAYMTLRQFEESAGSSRLETRSAEWDTTDPGLFLCSRTALLDVTLPARKALSGRKVVIASDVFCHRYASLRGQLRPDLLERVPTDARSILEFGCGEGALGSALKARQPCRVVGIEMDEAAAAVAATRLDAVLRGDVRGLIPKIDETFDCIVGGDILEHLDDPWTFLQELPRIARPGAALLLSLPNVASWPIIADLLAGRFDYVYMGITCVGHLRFFTRKSIGEMLRIGGWDTIEIEPQPPFATPEFEEFRRKLDEAAIQYSLDDLLAPGYYVHARRAAAESLT